MTTSNRPLLYSVMAIAGYAASAPLLAYAMSTLGRSCSHDRLQTYCRDVDAYTYQPVAYLFTATVLAAIMLGARLWCRARPWYPALLIFGSVAFFTMAYDTLLQRPIIQDAKLVNDTFNTLRSAITASFLLVFFVARRMTFSIAAVIAAVVVSYVGAGAASALFYQAGGEVIGATRLYFLLLIYAFVGFSAHLMAVSVLFANGRLEPCR